MATTPPFSLSRGGARHADDPCRRFPSRTTRTRRRGRAVDLGLDFDLDFDFDFDLELELDLDLDPDAAFFFRAAIRVAAGLRFAVADLPRGRGRSALTASGASVRGGATASTIWFSGIASKSCAMPPPGPPRPFPRRRTVGRAGFA